MSDFGPREWRFYIDDMIGFAENVISYTDGLDQAAFVARRLNYDATLRNLELIGEAATHLPETVWSIIQNDIPALLPELRALKARLA